MSLILALRCRREIRGPMRGDEVVCQKGLGQSHIRLHRAIERDPNHAMAGANRDLARLSQGKEAEAAHESDSRIRINKDLKSALDEQIKIARRQVSK